MKILITTLLLIITFSAVAQERTYAPVHLGLGVGLDFGGFGGQVTLMPDPHFALFGGVGYALVGTGYNIGARARINPKAQTCFTFGYMYGYNGVIKAPAAGSDPAFRKMYYGSSLEFGCEIRRKTTANYFSLGVIVPFRDPAFENDKEALEAKGFTFNNILPVLISFGYHFAL